MRGQVLLIDDEEALCDAVRRILGKEGYTVGACGTGGAGLVALEDASVAVAIIDLQLPDLDGVELLSRIRAAKPEVEVIVLTGRGSVGLAVEAMRLGAYDFLEKPIDRSVLVKAVHKAAEKRWLTDENRELRRRLRREESEPQLIGETAPMRKLRKLLRQIAPTGVRVLVRGESGTGKEVATELLHAWSDRPDRPIVKISCAAIPEHLLESELFGYERGAFTGAAKAKPGRLEMASGGTLFLDEIAEMSPRLQAKLLRVLQDGVFQRLGGTRDFVCDARVVSATHVDLERAIADKTFRQDLYYRLNVAQIEIPPLRQRSGDIPLLAAAFLRKFAEFMHKKPPTISPAGMEQLMRHTWPGNVRELENAIQRGVALASTDTIQSFVLAEAAEPPAAVAAPNETIVVPLGARLSDIEDKVILATLEYCGGNKEKAARTLGISARTLYRQFQRKGT